MNGSAVLRRRWKSQSGASLHRMNWSFSLEFLMSDFLSFLSLLSFSVIQDMLGTLTVGHQRRMLTNMWIIRQCKSCALGCFVIDVNQPAQGMVTFSFTPAGIVCSSWDLHIMCTFLGVLCPSVRSTRPRLGCSRLTNQVWFFLWCHCSEDST